MKWLTLNDEPLKLHGLCVHEGHDYFRLPMDIIDSVSEGVSTLARHSAGGRIRFRTDAKTLNIRYAVAEQPMAGTNMSCLGRSGADVYVDGIYRGGKGYNFATSSFITFSVEKQERMQDVEVYLPCYNRILLFEVGFPEDAKIEAPKPYTIEKPIVFYGSSITQGGAESRPGINYIATVCRKLDADFINLGFSGNAKGEPVMREYVASLPMSAFVLDYDHNAPTPEHLQNTHYPFYKAVREQQPELPILMMSKPDFDSDYTEAAMEENRIRRDIVKATYEKALSEGDKKVWFLDGQTLFGDTDRDSCTADGCHPNDLGFYRMAERVLPYLREMLK